MQGRKHGWIAGMATAAALLAGCMSGSSSYVPPVDDEFPVSPYDALFEGVPPNESIPEEGASAVYPPLHTELLATQTSVRSQGSRGVCSIFSTVALMEHLYLKAGAVNPDFSEHFLQWSTKFEVGAFPKTSGSNAQVNLKSISQYGIVDEATYPYQTKQWGIADDAACDGSDAQPTLCYTNGHPSEDIKQARRFKLPAGKYLNTNSIKAHITNKKTGVIVGMKFFYQSWNHRLSTLPTNADYWAKGYVLYPNAKDKEESELQPAGHSILIVGWDDNLEVPIVDEAGKPVLGTDGKPKVEKGFYIFKNSWGTGKFGVHNPHGDGYGYLSMRYVREYGSAYVSDVPALPAEQCTDEIDNNLDGKIDCADAACAGHASCPAQSETIEVSNDTDVTIPDNVPAGVSSSIEIAAAGKIQSLEIKVDIAHTYRGDLKVWLVRGTKSVVLHNRTGGSQDHLVATFTVGDFHGQDIAGTWTLFVSDNAKIDTGTLRGWSLIADVQ